MFDRFKILFNSITRVLLLTLVMFSHHSNVRIRKEEDMFDELKAKIHTHHIIIAGTLIFYLIYNYLVPNSGIADDLWFLKKSQEGPWIDYLIGRYQNWTSRLLIESTLLFFVNNFGIWKLVNAIAMTFITILPAYIFVGKDNDRKILNKLLLLSVFLFSFIPQRIFYDAGWVATSTNYLFPITAAMIATYPIVTALKAQKPPLWQKIIAIPFFIYACNQEQLVVCLFLFLLVSGIYLGYKRRKKELYFVIGFLLVDLLSLIFILGTPGNEIRSQVSKNVYFTNYDSLSFINKIDLSWSSTFKAIFFDFHVLYIVFLLIVTTFLFVKSGSWISKIVIFFPIAVQGYYLLSKLNIIHIKTLDAVYNQFIETGTAFNLNSPASWTVHIMIIIILTIIVASLFIIAISLQEFLIMTGLLTLGVISKMILGFSPSVWISGERVLTILLYFLLLVCVQIISPRLQTSKIANWIVLVTFLGFVGKYTFLVIIHCN